MTQPLARDLIPALLAALADLPVVVLTGMRQTGKSTLLTSTKIYVALRDAEAERNGLLRIVDESGEDYLTRASASRRSSCSARWQQRDEPWPFPGQVHPKNDPARRSARIPQKRKRLICPCLSTRRGPVWTLPVAPGLQSGSDHFPSFPACETAVAARA